MATYKHNAKNINRALYMSMNMSKPYYPGVSGASANAHYRDRLDAAAFLEMHEINFLISSDGNIVPMADIVSIRIRPTEKEDEMIMKLKGDEVANSVFVTYKDEETFSTKSAVCNLTDQEFIRMTYDANNYIVDTPDLKEAVITTWTRYRLQLRN